MKNATIALFCLILALGTASAAFGKSYQCVKPGGAVICTVDSAASPSDDPSVLCNKTCEACYLTCTAVEVIVKGGGKIIIGPGTTTNSNMVRPGGSDKETAKEVLQEGLVQ